MAFVTLVDVGGYQVGVEVKGSGPLVVFVSAQGEPAQVWAPVWQRMSAAATLVTYDRGGIGASDAVREPEVPRPYGWFADELDATLRALSFAEPAVLVAHSFGCLIARVYAASHPDRVRGLVLAEPSQLTLWDDDDPYQHDGARPDATTIDTVAGAPQVVPLARRWPSVVLTRTPGRWLSPLATIEVDERWRAEHAQLAAGLGAVHIIAADAGHAIVRQAPSLVALAVDSVLDADGCGGVRLEGDAVRAAGGRT